MTQYLIEREISGIGSADHDSLKSAAGKSNQVLADMVAEGKNIKWLNSYVAKDQTFCIYEADDESLIHEHSRRSGFPADRIIEIGGVISPATAGE